MCKRFGRFGIWDWALLLLCALLFLGTLTVFRACGPKEDGGFMTCHWAGRAVTGASALLFCLSAARFIVKDPGARAGLSLAVLLAAVFTALLPGTLIDLCMMGGMRCRALLRPGVITGAALIMLSAAGALWSRHRAEREP